MILVKVSMSPNLSWMRIFDDLQEHLRDALFPVVADLVQREEICFDSEYNNSPNIRVVIRICWKHPLKKASPDLRQYMALEAKAATLNFIMKHFPNMAASVDVSTPCKE
jgi:hypothetical protein